MKRRHAITLALVLVLLGCPSNDDGDQNTLATTASDTGGCPPGTETCACLPGGVCNGDLICASQLCVDFGGSSGADDGETDKTESGGVDTSSGGGEPGSCVGHCDDGEMVPHFGGVCFCEPSCKGQDGEASTCCPDYEQACPGDCLFNDECSADEVCNSAQTCVPAWGQQYEVCVTYWRDHTSTCWDFDDCYADVYFKMSYGGEAVLVSETHDDVTETSWDDCAIFEINSDIDDGTQSNEVWATFFYDEDGIGSPDATNHICEPNGTGGCTFIPLDYLRWGTVYWTASADVPFDVTVRFLALSD